MTLRTNTSVRILQGKYMRFFLKCFVTALAIQLILLGLILATGFGDHSYFIFLFYMVPYIVLDLLFLLPEQAGIGPISFFLLASLPAVVYSALIALIITLIRKFASRNP